MADASKGAALFGSCAESEGGRMTCPACGGRMKPLPNVDAAECRKCRWRQTDREIAAKQDYSADMIRAMQQAMQAYYPWLDANMVPRPRRRDGMDPDNAYVICGVCGDRWEFPDMALGDYCLSPCQHAFLRRDPNESSRDRRDFYGPGADYVMTMEPPE